MSKIMTDLAVQLSANTAELKKGLDSANRNLNQLNNNTKSIGKQMTQSFRQVGMALVAAFSAQAIFYGIRNTITGLMTMADRIKDLTEITGASTDKLQEWNYIAKIAGVNTEVYSTAIEGLTQKLARGTGESATLTNAFEKLGVSTRDAYGELRKGNEITDDVIDKLAGMSNTMERNTIGAALFGGAWKDLAPILGRGREGIEELRKEAHKLGAVLDSDQLNKADEIREAWARLGTQFDALKNMFVLDLGNVFSGLVGGLQAVLKLIKPVTEFIGRNINLILALTGAYVAYRAVMWTLTGVTSLVVAAQGAYAAAVAWLKKETVQATPPTNAFTIALAAQNNVVSKGALSLGMMSLSLKQYANHLNAATLAAKGTGAATGALALPFIKIVAILAAVGAGIYLFTRSKNSLKKATDDLSISLGTELSLLEGSFTALKKTEANTVARARAIENINSKYGQYLDNLLTEKSSVDDIAKAYDKASQALLNHITLKINQENLEKRLAAYQEKVREGLGKYQDAFVDSGGREKLPDYMIALRDAMASYREEVNKSIKTEKKLLEQLGETKSGTPGQINRLKKLEGFADYENSLKEAKNIGKEFYTQFLSGVEEIDKSISLDNFLKDFEKMAGRVAGMGGGVGNIIDDIKRFQDEVSAMVGLISTGGAGGAGGGGGGGGGTPKLLTGIVADIENAIKRIEDIELPILDIKWRTAQDEESKTQFAKEIQEKQTELDGLKLKLAVERATLEVTPVFEPGSIAAIRQEISRINDNLDKLNIEVELETDPASISKILQDIQSLENEKKGLEKEIETKLKIKIEIPEGSIAALRQELEQEQDKLSDLQIKLEFETDISKKTEILSSIKEIKDSIVDLQETIDIETGELVKIPEGSIEYLDELIRKNNVLIGLQTDPAVIASLKTQNEKYIEMIHNLEGVREKLDFFEEIGTAFKSISESISAASIAVNAVQDSFGALSNVMVDSMFKIEGAWENFGDTMLNIVKDVIRMLLTQMIAGILASLAPKGPLGWLAAPGVIAANKALFSSAAGSIPKMASGGIVSGRTLVEVGEYPNARSNPEVIAPLDKLKSLLAADSLTGGEVRFEIEGDKLVGILSKHNKKQIYFS